MDLSAGTRLGPYEIVASLGAGSMGEVYRARDTKLKREVAIKVLPASLSTDADQLARFRREAEVLASLNHPHIAAIYGLEEGRDGPESKALALVMELVEGEDLSQRIARGALTIDEALPIAKQIAEALEAAHERGFIHRDLKPANIKVREDGTVKLLDFGLAKALESPPTAAAVERPRGSNSASSSATSMSPTVTYEGTILGTAAYMAPEQAKGQPVGRRADVWAFGVVLYEMLVGRHLFAGANVSETLTAVLTTTPDVSALPAATPPTIRRLVERCLVKDPRQRLDSMTAARMDIEDARRMPPARLDTPGRSAMTRVTIGTLAATALALLVVGLAIGRMIGRGRAGDAPPITIAELAAPPGVISAFHDGFAISPDGTSIAFAARAINGDRRIWIRRFEEATARPIDGTADGFYPFWSPDGAHIAFWAANSLRRVQVSGGSPLTICTKVGAFLVGSWSDRGDIVFSDALDESPIMKVPAGGGSCAPAGVSGRAPQWLPGGREFLFATGGAKASSVNVASADGGTPRQVVALEPIEGLETGDPWRFAYSPPGYLFTNRGDTLTVQRIDPQTVTAMGSPVAIAPAAADPKNWFAVAAAGNSLAALIGGEPPAQLRWVDRQGTLQGALGETSTYWSMRLAPDGRRAIVNVTGANLIIGPGARPVRLPDLGYGGVWSPDGSEVVFHPWTGGPRRKRVDPDSPSVDLPGLNRGELVLDWSPDGTSLLVTRPHEGRADTDIVIYSLASGTVRDLLTSPANELHGRFSPDGRSVAYSSDASGDFELYIRDLTSGASTPVPIGIGDYPAWRRDGRELFYLAPNDEVMAVAITPGTLQPVDRPRALFRIPLNDVTRLFLSPFDVAPDGERFLLNVPETPAPLFYVRGLEQWLAKK